MTQPFSVFRDKALANFDLPERALLIRLRFCSHLLTEAYHGLKRCRSRPAFLKRLQQIWFGPISEIFPELGKRIFSLIQYLEKEHAKKPPQGTRYVIFNEKGRSA